MRRIAGAVLAISLVSLAGCGELLDPAAAVVGTNKITVTEIEDGLDKFLATDEYKRLAAQGNAKSIQREFEQAYLSQKVREAVLLPEADERGVEITDEKVQDRIDQIKDDFPTQGAFEEALKEQGVSPDQLEELVHLAVLEDELKAEVTADAGPTEEDLRTYYDAHIDQFTQTRAQHILVKEKAVAAQLSQQLQSAPKAQVDALFAQLAEQFSTDTANASKAGDLGYFSKGDVVEEFEKAAAGLTIGQVSDPVKTDFGYHIIRVTDRKVTPFGKARQDIVVELGADSEEEVWQRWLVGAYRRADIRVNSRYGELDPETQQIVDATAETIPGAERESPAPTPTAP